MQMYVHTINALGAGQKKKSVKKRDREEAASDVHMLIWETGENKHCTPIPNHASLSLSPREKREAGRGKGTKKKLAMRAGKKKTKCMTQTTVGTPGHRHLDHAIQIHQHGEKRRQ